MLGLKKTEHVAWPHMAGKGWAGCLACHWHSHTALLGECLGRGLESQPACQLGRRPCLQSPPHMLRHHHVYMGRVRGDGRVYSRRQREVRPSLHHVSGVYIRLGRVLLSAHRHCQSHAGMGQSRPAAVLVSILSHSMPVLPDTQGMGQAPGFHIQAGPPPKAGHARPPEERQASMESSPPEYSSKVGKATSLGQNGWGRCLPPDAPPSPPSPEIASLPTCPCLGGTWV